MPDKHLPDDLTLTEAQFRNVIELVAGRVARSEASDRSPLELRRLIPSLQWFPLVLVAPLFACVPPHPVPGPQADSAFAFRIDSSGNFGDARYTFSLPAPSAILIVAAASGEAGLVLAPADTKKLISLPAGRHALVGNRAGSWPALAPIPTNPHVVVLFPPAPAGAPPSSSEQRWPVGTRAEVQDESGRAMPVGFVGIDRNRSWSVYLVVLSRTPEVTSVHEALAELSGRRSPATQVERMRRLLERGGIEVRVVGGAESP